ncbi:MAG: carbohydrate ABC transporter substrate-binding protein [Ruminococcaceae bacterium]|nr:carbohydrate ABC transporter substrate-binding protein [Oscillospiraceae bacterium]
MKKIVSYVLSLLMISSLFFTVSCGAQEEEIFDVPFDVELEVDLTGLHFIWGSEWDQEICPSRDFSIVGDKIHKRFDDLKAKYGCTMEVVHWEDGSARTLQELAAGMNSIDFLDSHASAGGIQLYRANLLVALEDIPNIDLSDEKFGVPRFVQYGVFDGKRYGFYHYAWEFPPEYHGVLMFNTDLLHSIGINTPHEYKENNDWTWANFKEYLLSIQDAARNAGYGDDFVPYISGNSYAADAIGFMFANGLQMINSNGNGNYSFGFDCPEGFATVEFLKDLYDNGLYAQKGTGVFVIDQMSAMMSHETYWATHYYEKSTSQNYLPAQDYEYGLVGFPYGPNGNENSVSGYVHHGRRLNWVLNSSGKELSEIGLVMDYVFSALDDSEGWYGYFRDQIFYTKEDHENYVYMLENVNFNYGNLYLEKGYDTWTSGISAAILGNKSVSEVFSSSGSAIDEAIKKNVTWTFEELE